MLALHFCEYQSINAIIRKSKINGGKLEIPFPYGYPSDRGN